MKATQLTLALERCFARKRPCFTWGAPGIGKSSIYKQTAKRMKYNLIDVRCVLLDPVDLRGLPHVENNTSKWAIPDFLPREERDGQNGVLFLDELNAAPPLVQAACYQLVLDRQLGEYVLPKGWVVAAAGNRTQDGAVTSRMPTPLKNRLVHFELEVDNDDWYRWAAANGISEIVIGFLHFRTNLLSPTDVKRDENAFPSPRSWEFVSDLISDNATTSKYASVEVDLIAGCVGPGACSEFMSFLKHYRDLPDIDQIIEHPKTAGVPKDPAGKWAVSSALSTRGTAKNFDAISIYLDRLDPEFSVFCIKDMTARDKTLMNLKGFTKWGEKYIDILR